MKFYFFSLRDFKVDVGESVRMYGILNSLAEDGHDVVFISNAARYDMFHQSIEHFFIGSPPFSKRKFQALLSALPPSLVYWQFKAVMDKIEKVLIESGADDRNVYFFDYLDNSFGYLLKKNRKIKGYINDIHGIATIEFENAIANSKTIKEKIIAKAKLKSVRKLDKKVFEFADGFIFGSEKMKRYYEREYEIKGKRSDIIPYLLGKDAIERTVDESLVEKLKHELFLLPNDFIFLFVGSYKPTAGVDDLITAFDKLSGIHKNVRLLLIGSGPTKAHCVELANRLPSKERIHFRDHISYKDLNTWQSLANVIVCPDKENPYSQYVIHVKYLDALISGKLVINGAFDSVMELNRDNFLSLTFKPSDGNDLLLKLKACVEDFENLSEKYKGTRDYAAQNLSYKTYIKLLAN